MLGWKTGGEDDGADKYLDPPVASTHQLSCCIEPFIYIA